MTEMIKTLTDTAFSFLKICSNHNLWQTQAQQAIDGHSGQLTCPLLQYWTPHFKSKSQCQHNVSQNLTKTSPCAMG